MIYAVDEGQLLGLWTVMRLFDKIYEITDQESRTNVLTEAQTHLVAFVLQLTPLQRHQARAVKFQAKGGQTPEYQT